MHTLWQDLRFGARMLAKSPVLTAVAVLTLALGIGANTAIFSVVNSVLLRPFPLPESERLVILWQNTSALSVMTVSYPDYLDYRQQNSVFEEIALYNRYQNRNLTGVDRPERIPTGIVTSSIFRALGIQPIFGRAFLPQEDARGGDRVVLLSHGLWQRRFGGDSGIVGRKITLDGQPFTVVGVLPPNLQFMQGVDLWLPMGTFVSDALMNRDNHIGMFGVARLKTGVTLERARAEMTTIAKRLEQQYPDSDADVGVGVTPLYEARVGDVRPALLLLLGAVGFVLLIACVNVANLLLARAASREKETAIRAALGANRVRLIRQLLTETLLLALAGGALGWLLSLWSVDLVRAWGMNQIPRAAEIRLDARVLVFTLVAALLCGILAGLAPALQSSRVNLSEALKEGGRGQSTGRGSHRMRNLLVVGEVALSFMLLIGAGLLIRSFVALQSVNPGFAPEQVLSLRMSLPAAKYPDGSAQVRFVQQLLERARGVPGVGSVGLTANLPFSEDGNQTSFVVEGQPEPEPGKAPLIDIAPVTEDYFRTMGIPVLRGRAFAEQDVPGSPQVVIVSESFVRRFWPNVDPVGKRIGRQGDSRHPTQWLSVVGVVGDTNRFDLERIPRPEVYLPFGQKPDSGLSLVVRTTSDPASLTAALREQVAAVDKDQPVYGVMTMHERVAASLAERRFSMVLLSVFAGLAFLLAAIGLYGVVSYAVAQRTHEIGIRIALGADRRQVLRLVVGHGLTLALAGAAVGAVGSLGLARFIAKLLFGVQATDLVTYLAVAAVLIGVALLACYVPARRATRVDPMVALRYE